VLGVSYRERMKAEARERPRAGVGFLGKFEIVQLVTSKVTKKCLLMCKSYQGLDVDPARGGAGSTCQGAFKSEGGHPQGV